MASLFRRRNQLTDPADASGDAVAGSAPASDPAGTADPDDAKTRGYTPGKGRPTPKRKEAERRKSAEPPPANRKEAVKRLREKQRQERLEARGAMMRGEEKYLPKRDQGEERAITRDVVDVRHNVGTWFFAGAVVILVGTSGAMPPQVRVGAEFLWYGLALAFIVDSVLLSRRVKSTVLARVPKTTERFGGMYLYAIMRSITFRRLRMPKPRVKSGEKLL